MRTHGRIGFLYECETDGKHFIITRPFIKSTTLDWLRHSVAPIVEAAGVCVLQRVVDGAGPCDWITLHKPDKPPPKPST